MGLPKNCAYLEDHFRTCKWLVTSIYKQFRSFGRGTTPVRGLTITMVINHVSKSGMILQEGQTGASFNGFHWVSGNSWSETEGFPFTKHVYMYITWFYLVVTTIPTIQRGQISPQNLSLVKKSQAWNTGFAAVAVFGPSEDGFFCGYSVVDFFGEGCVLAT